MSRVRQPAAGKSSVASLSRRVAAWSSSAEAYAIIDRHELGATWFSGGCPAFAVAAARWAGHPGSVVAVASGGGASSERTPSGWMPRSSLCAIQSLSRAKDATRPTNTVGSRCPRRPDRCADQPRLLALAQISDQARQFLIGEVIGVLPQDAADAGVNVHASPDRQAAAAL